MKIKTRIVLMTFFFSIILTSCGAKIDAVSQKMIDDINALGEITLEDEDEINKLIDRYSTLTDKQKEGVNNYATLLEAQDKVNGIKADQKEKLMEELNEPHIKAAIAICNEIKKGLLNPESFVLKEVSYCEKASDGFIYYDIKYTGENQLGGRAQAEAFANYADSDGSYEIYTDDDGDDYIDMLEAWAKILGGNEKMKAAGFSQAYSLDEELIMKCLDK